MRVLVAEDSVSVLRLLEKQLGTWGYDVTCVNDGAAAWDILQKPDCPRLAILDWMMPGLDGIEVCRMLREKNTEPYVNTPYIYLILLTAKDSGEDVVAGLEAGADDYIIKPFDSDELRVRVRAGKRIVNLQSAMVAAYETLRQEASHDPLTGLFNRRAIINILNRDFSRALREGAQLAVMMIDLDFFKQVNDRYGHAAGDEVLAEVSRRMNHVLRAYDALARLGGEEFVAVVPGCDLGGAQIVAERMRTAVAARAVPLGGDVTVNVSCSIGVALLSPVKHSTAPALLEAADAALYVAKSKGRNCVEFAS